MAINTSGILSSLRGGQLRTNQIVTQLTELRQNRTLGPLKDTKESINSEIDHVNSVTKKMRGLLDSLNAIDGHLSGFNGAGANGLEVTSSHTILDATATNSATAKDYNVDINSIAQSQIKLSQTFSSGTGTPFSVSSNNTSIAKASIASGSPATGNWNLDVQNDAQKDVWKSDWFSSTDGTGLGAESNDGSVATATVDSSFGGSTSNPYKIQVGQLAGRNTYSFNEIGDPSGAVKGGTLELQANTSGGTESLSLNIEDGEQIQEVATKINDEFGDYVTANVDSNGKLGIQRTKAGYSMSASMTTTGVTGTALSVTNNNDGDYNQFTELEIKKPGGSFQTYSTKGREITQSDHGIDGLRFRANSTGSTEIQVGSSMAVVGETDLQIQATQRSTGNSSQTVSLSGGQTLQQAHNEIETQTSGIAAEIVSDGNGNHRLKITQAGADARMAGNELFVREAPKNNSSGQHLGFEQTQDSTGYAILEDPSGNMKAFKSPTVGSFKASGLDINLQGASGETTINVDGGDGLVADGNLNLDIRVDEGTDQSIDVTVEDGDGLQAVKEKINDKAGSYVTAKVVENSGDYELKVTRDASGSGNTVSFTHNENTNATGKSLTSFTEDQSDQDATGNVDGDSFSSNDNQVTKNGLDLTLNQTGTNETVTVEDTGGGTVDNADDLKTDIQDFVDKYNSAIEKLNEDSEMSRGAKWRAKRAMQDVIAERVDGMTGQYGNLSSIGIDTNFETGKLNINDSELDAALNDKPDTVGAIFGKQDDGINDALGDVVEGYVGPGESVFDTTIESLENRKDGVENQISDAEERIDGYQQRLADRFNQLKMMRQQMQTNFRSLL